MLETVVKHVRVKQMYCIEKVLAKFLGLSGTLRSHLVPVELCPLVTPVGFTMF